MASNRLQPRSVASLHPPLRGEARVVANERDRNGWKIRLALSGWPGALPGQFVMVGAGALALVPRRDPLLPRPMAVYREHPVGDGSPSIEVELLYRVVGRGTTLLSEATPGDRVTLVGPLGRGFPVEPDRGAALLVGGGTGIASLYGLARALRAAGRPVTVLLGARGADDLIGVDDFAALADETGLELVRVTEDGSLGERGLVTGPLGERLADAGDDPQVFAVGPTPMMRACAELASAQGVECLVSLENPMACGFGVCLGCAAPRAEGGFSLVCRAGPVFASGEIEWEGLP